MPWRHRWMCTDPLSKSVLHSTMHMLQTSDEIWWWTSKLFHWAAPSLLVTLANAWRARMTWVKLVLSHCTSLNRTEHVRWSRQFTLAELWFNVYDVIKLRIREWIFKVDTVLKGFEQNNECIGNLIAGLVINKSGRWRRAHSFVLSQAKAKPPLNGAFVQTPLIMHKSIR